VWLLQELTQTPINKGFKRIMALFDEDDNSWLMLAAIHGLIGGFLEPECLLAELDPEIIEGFLEEFGEN